MKKNEKRKINIAMVCDPIGSNKSGVVVSTLRFGRLLKERGHHVIFIGAKSDEHKNNTHYDGIKIYLYRSLPVPKSGGWRLAFPTVHELKKVFQEEKIEVVHVVLPMSGAIVAIKAANALGIKIVAHSHSQPENLFTDMPKMLQPTLCKLWNKYLAWLYSKAELIIYPSKLGYDLLHHLAKKGKPHEIISNGVNENKYKPTDPGDFYSRFKIPKDSINLAYVGRLYPEKSIDTLIKAIPTLIKKTKKIHLMLAGAGHVRPKLEKLVRDLNVGEYVTFLGLVSDEDKILAYNACDIFVSPSLAELEGMTVLEAMACGKPIIVPDAEMNAARFFVEDNGLLFKNRDYADLAEKILILAENTELRKKMGENSLKKVKKYDIKRSIDLLEEVYYRVLKSDKSMMQESYLNNEIYYRINEFKPDRQTLVFIHGVSGSSSAWLPYEKIFENKYNILTYDIRGHGMSKKYPNYSDYEIKKFSEDLDNLIAHLKLEKFVLISNSFGGLVHLEYFKSHKENVIANIFTSPEFYLNDNFLIKIFRFILEILIWIIGLLPFNSKPRGHVDYSRYINSTDWDIKRNLADMRNTGLRSHFYTLRQSMNIGQEYNLEKIDTPTLIIHGEKDTMVPLENAVAVSRKIKSSEFVSIPNVDHNTVHNAVKRMSEAIEHFVEKIKPNLS